MPDLRDGFLFRMEDLHIVFCAIKVIEKVIDGSRLDQAILQCYNEIL